MAAQREMKGKNPWHRPVTILIAVLGVIAIVALVTVTVMQNQPLHQKYKYGIVLDAGSSHTAMYIYQWPAEKDNDTGRVQQTHACKVNGPGISSYWSSPSQAGDSLRKCLQDAERQVPLSRHQETPLYLGATAGMRLLSKENRSASSEVFRAVERELQRFPFSFQGARILTGQEEGAFGWVTVNYLDDRLRQGLGTRGALDLGGASTQISFVSNQEVESSENAVAFRLYGNDYHLYTHSFLCYGKDQVLKLALVQLTESGERQVSDPCFHPGYNVTKEYSAVYNSPCVTARKSKETSFTHIGTGNALKCQEVVRRVLDFGRCNFSSCSFNQVYQPPLRGTFRAFSAFYFVMNFLNLTSDPLERVKEKLEHYCATPWTQVKQDHPDIKEKYLAEYCFSGTYIVTLLTEGYNFTSESWNDIKFIKKISGSDAGWTLGYMLNLTNMVPAEAPDTPPLPYAGFVTIVTCMALLLVFLLVLSLRSYWPRCRPAQTRII
ncbi:ectonucleoside triphosphate diphosphohydrolase 1 [Hypomesus transpacificus]|uniref:ectonucleoside triphosphate diphosphohydrolase 1 n=1 Tax=Hypomesus transpacificus TaxID=137520 RepID=UPI001F081240|nr:ectonucleoside triphosphate diphosphohydrolase 1 [Hypomesus transpacificus]